MILVTGATGFLGSELCLQLANEHGHFLAMRRPESMVPEQLARINAIEWVDGNLVDAEAVKKLLDKVTQVFHCAATVSFHPDKDQEMFEFNVEGTKNLVAECIDNNIRLVHVSSVAVFDDPVAGKTFTTEEDYPAAPPVTHAYGLTKYLSEQAVWDGVKNGLNAVVVNPSIIMGAVKNYGGSGAFFSVVKGGLKFYTTGGAGFVAVEDVAACMIKLMKTDIRDERFIISGENLTYKQLFTLIAEGYGIKPPPFKARPWMLELGWRGAQFISYFTRTTPSFTQATAKSSLNVSLYANDKIRKATGHKFIELKTAIKRTVEQYSHLK